MGCRAKRVSPGHPDATYVDHFMRLLAFGLRQGGRIYERLLTGECRAGFRKRAVNLLKVVLGQPLLQEAIATVEYLFNPLPYEQP